MFLKSGDIAVMSLESRLSYHAVPRIVPTDVSWLNGMRVDVAEGDDSSDVDGNEIQSKRRRIHENSISIDSFVDDIWHLTNERELWQPFAEYIADCRINVNVRQVLNAHETSL